METVIKLILRWICTILHRVYYNSVIHNVEPIYSDPDAAIRTELHKP